MLSVSSKRFTFTKKERLSGRKIIEELFKKGSSLHVPPFRLLWMETAVTDAGMLRAGFSVPARNFRLAVDRNRIKRQMREVYRKNKWSLSALIEDKKRPCVLMIVYTAKTKMPFPELETKLLLTLKQLEKEYKKYTG